jgi:hypothetical protein
MTDLPYRLLTLKETIARICADERITWLTMTDQDGTYEVAIETPARRDRGGCDARLLHAQAGR